MKCLIIVTQLESGGAQAAAIKLFNGLKKDHHTDLLFFYKKTNAYPDIDEKKILINKDKPGIADKLLLIFSLYKFIKKNKYDAVVSFTYYANILGQLISFLLGVKIRIASQRNPSQTYPNIARILDRLFGTMNIYSKNVMVSKTVMDSFLNYPERYKEKCTVIYNGYNQIDLNFSKSQLREEFGFQERDFICINVGRLSKQKNQEFLIDIAKRMPHIKFLVAGEGDLRSLLEEKKGSLNNFILLGELSPDDINKYLCLSDVFLFPSSYEGMSNALIEALFHNLPVIASDIDPNKEVLNNDNLINCLSVNRIHDWINIINSLNDDHVLRKEYCNFAANRSGLFSIEKMIYQFDLLITGKNEQN